VARHSKEAAMTRTHRRTTDERLYAAAQDSFTAEGAPPAVTGDDDVERRMKALLVSFDGVQYVYNGFRYDQRSDAMAYASLMQSRPAQFDKGNTMAPPPGFSAPSEAQRALMATLGIELGDHAYRFEGFRYDRLADAVAYARQTHPDQRPEPT
jgi:hypothetical protein